MERDYGKEIDALREQVMQLTQMVVSGNPDAGDNAQEDRPVYAGHIQKMPAIHPNPAIRSVLDELENLCGDTGSSGRLSYVGVYESGGKQSTWVRHQVDADALLTLIENHTAEKVLACIGSNDRLTLLLALLREPMTVAQLVTRCGWGSTGQVYHHLKPLIAADLVAEDDHKGCYAVKPHRVQGIIMLLAGISDMTDPSYTQGTF